MAPKAAPRKRASAARAKRGGAVMAGRALATALPRDLLQAALDAGGPLYVAAPDGRLLYANAAYREIAAHVAGPGERALVAAEEIAAAGGQLRGEHALAADGDRRRYLAEHSLVTDAAGAPRAVIARFTPLAAGEAEPRRRLALAEARLDDVAQLVSDWLWETDRALAVTFVSPRASEALGRHPREIVGRALTALPATGGEVLAERLARRPPAAFRDLEVEIAHGDGGRRLFRLAGLPIHCPDSGGFLGFRGTAQDVTELAARERALREAKDAAEIANRAKSRFLANMSHELRTPLNAIIGFSEIMREEAFGAIGSPQYRGYAADILTSARHLLAVINDVLDVSRVEAGKLDLEEETVDPLRLAAQAARMVSEAAERAGVAVETALPQETPLLRADARKLTQVLLNLLSNAVKFTARGGRVELGAGRRGDGSFAFCVSDDGIGMNESDLDVALTPFGQVDSRIARRFEGSGLGLPLAKALIELHGGRLEVDSAPEAGTRVIIALPAARVVQP